MNKLQSCLLLLATALLAVQCHRMLAEEQLPERSLAEADAAEHQRILAELEEVHQLRERMLQEGIHNHFLLSDCFPDCFSDPNSMLAMLQHLTRG